jgi:hypothetical protein
MKNYNEILNIICANEHFYTDEELAKKFQLAYEDMPRNITFTHAWSNNIIARRVKEYCDYNKIELKDYNGPLPFRVFVMPTRN